MTSRIDFVIPAYNARDTLGDTLSSLTRQTDPRWTAIIIDDGSTDGTADLVRTVRDDHHEGRILLARQRNTGLAGARNTGFALTRADLVCFLDADDTIEPAFVATMARAIGDHLLVACATNMVGPSLQSLAWTIAPSPADATIERLIEFNPFAVGSVVLRRRSPFARSLLCIGQLDLFDASLPVHEDWDLWLRLTAAGAHWAPPVADALFNYRLRRGSLTTDIQRMHDVGLTVIERAPVESAHRTGTSRRWTLRHLARAIAADDVQLTATLLDRAQSPMKNDLSERDLGVLTGALTHALCQTDRVGPGQIDHHCARWQARVARTLTPSPMREMLMVHIDNLAADWLDIAHRALASLEPGQELVVYGVGRNGRSLLAALEHLQPGSVVCWIDDHPDTRACRFSRLAPEQLDQRHVVIVTPDDTDAIVQSLAARPVARVLTRASLMAAHRQPVQSSES